MKKSLALLAFLAAAATVSAAPLTPDQDATLKRISANSLRGHLSFIASDLLEGRGTPSRGQDLAAEYIAAQYRRAGLEPLGDDEYFQTANWLHVLPEPGGFKFALRAGGQSLALPVQQLSFKPGKAIAANGAAVIKASWDDLAPLEALGAAVKGKVVLVEAPAMRPKSQAEWEAMNAARKAVLDRIHKLEPLLVLALDRNRPAGDAGGRGELRDPAQPAPAAQPNVAIHGEQAAALFDAMPAGASGSLDLNLAEASVKQVKLRNVAAVLRGSDPKLKDTYVIFSAHYDHLGMRADMPGDNIFNGANDDGSGTVSLIEVASAMAHMKQRPKRSIVFLNVFGEELGMLGSSYYGRHPLVPVAKTIANVNLEQVGRTDGKAGPVLNKVNFTGFDMTGMPGVFARAGKLTGVEVIKDAEFGDKYFALSDNVAMAKLGVPAHTMSVLYEFPDYHKAGDHWQKIDYDNMARVNRMVALGLMMLANDPAPPRWNEAHPMVAPYVKAFKALSN